MGRYDWYTKVTESHSSNDTTFWLTVSCYFVNNGWNYSMYMTGGVSVSEQGWRTVWDRQNVNTTGVSQNGGTVLLGSHEYAFTKTKSARSIAYCAHIESDGGYADGSKWSGDSYITIPAKTSYKVTYNANGGSGAPDSQTKWYNEALTLSTTKPTRTGYTFLGWSTNSTATSASYSAGATLASSINYAVAFYAVWKINTWTVSYNTNGGSDAPSSQTKTYGKTLILSSTIPTRPDYNFLGWSTSSTATVATYAAGGSYTNNAGATLYAVWELAYTLPEVSTVKVFRCDSSGTEAAEGTCAAISFTWSCCQLTGDNPVASITANWGDGSTTVTASGTTGAVTNYVIGGDALSIDESYTITVTVTDTLGGSSSKTVTLPTSAFPIDIKAGGTGVAFGKVAELDGVLASAYPMYVYIDDVDGTNLSSVSSGVWAQNLLAKDSNGNTVGIYQTYKATDGSLWTQVGSCYKNSGSYQYSLCDIGFESDGRTAMIFNGGRVASMTSDGNYWGLRDPYGATNVWIRTTSAGLLPYASGGNAGSLGTSSWPFTNVCGKNFYWGTRKLCENKALLTDAGAYMHSGQTRTLSEPISSQPNGIVIVWSYYSDSTAHDYDWNYCFVPKWHVAANSGKGVVFQLSTGEGWYEAYKYLYISDSSITGRDTNASSESWYNTSWVLRYVIGV